MDDFEDFLRAYLTAMHRVALRVLHDYALAEDAVQEASRKLWQVWKQTGTVPSWTLACRVTRNAAIDLLRRRRLSSIGDRDDMPDPRGILDDLLFSRLRENKPIMRAAYDSLPPTRQKILYLKGHEGMSQKDIAVELGVSESHVSQELRTGLGRMFESYQRAGGDADLEAHWATMLWHLPEGD